MSRMQDYYHGRPSVGWQHGIEFLFKIPIAQNQWGNEGPEVERHADPTGCNLHPHSWLVCIHIQPI